MAHYDVKRHLTFYKDPFAEFFRRGCHCWILLAHVPIVNFKFVKISNEQRIEEEIEIQKIMEKYFTKKVERSVKKKVKHGAWRKKMKKISDEKLAKKKEKEKRKLNKMTELAKEEI